MATAGEKDGKCELRVAVSRMVPYTVERMVFRDRKLVPETRTYYKALRSITTLVPDGEDVKVCRKDGTAVDSRKLLELLKKETPIVVFTQVEMDLYYVHVMGERVVILIISEETPFPWRLGQILQRE
jgi:hypothetical protein